MTIRSITPSLILRGAGPRREGLLAWLHRALQAIESRRQLAAMDPRMLADIGISRAEALEEARRAPWDLAPSPRR
jgi:uncharacterized protein YjiS (DUF1127 family)